MDLSTLTAINPIDGRYKEKCTSLANLCSEFGLIKWRVIIEVQWFIFLSEKANFPALPTLSTESLAFLHDIINSFNHEAALQVKQIEATTRHDVKAVEYYLKEKFKPNQELTKYSEFIHFACTSEDINNLAYALMLKTTREQVYLPTLEKILLQLKSFAHENAAAGMLARTHGQPATPTTAGKEFANFIYRLEKQKKDLEVLPIVGKWNGAVGNYNAHLIAMPEINWPNLAQEFVEKMGITFNPYTTQIEPHDYIADLCDKLRHINTILIDFARDTWSYISLEYFSQKKQEHEVGSSTMPHKVNPIDFENAEGNLGLANALFSHFATKLPISRWQRDLSDSTVLRNLGVAFAYSIIALESLSTGLKKIVVNSSKLQEDLAKHWELLAEPIQTIMRLHGIESAYEQLKDFSRGKQLTEAQIKDFITQLALPETEKARLLTLSPENYLGYAENLAKRI